MSCTEISLDPTISADDFVAPDVELSQASNDPDIAPWDEPPTPPPKPQRTFPIPSKASFSNFAGIPRQGSSSNLFPRSSRGSDSHSIGESSSNVSLYNSPVPVYDSPSYNGSRTNTSIYSDTTLGANSQQDLRKAKSAINIFNKIKTSRSRTRLRSDAADRSRSPDSFEQYVPFRPLVGGSTSSLALSKKEKPSSRKKSANKIPLPLPPNMPGEPDINLDLNIDDMEGIVDLTVLPSTSQQQETIPSSPASFENYLSSGLSLSDASFQTSSPSAPIFSNANPFQPSAVVKRKHHLTIDQRRVSPKSQPGPVVNIQPPPLDDTASAATVAEEDPSWRPPQSWGFVEDGDEEQGEVEYSSSEESAHGKTVNGGAVPVKKRKRRKAVTKPRNRKNGYLVRIHRANNTYHVTSIPLTTTVAEITMELNQKLLLDSERETHRLYLKERGRERVLGQAERPADILRRRLEQAGYDVKDGLDKLGGEDLTFLLKFVYKTQLLGPVEGELDFNNPEYVDLTGRSLRTIPAPLHGYADMIVALTLSRNPMLEIPLDFIQSCTTLRELRLSNMSMKKVPQSVRYSTTLHRLDLSCNRIVDLTDAGLDAIPDLATLKVQNNRMERLPWYFPRLRSLKVLNISNNKFRSLPAVVCEMADLVDLDISFNMISELPEEIGQLVKLERLIIVGNQVTKFPDECSKLSSLRVLDCRRNHISDLTAICMLPNLETLSAEYNSVPALDLSLGPRMKALDASHNDITQLTLLPSPVGKMSYTLTCLDICHAKLSSLDNLALAQLPALENLRLDHNSFRFIPESLGELSHLTHLSCSNNSLDSLPPTIGRLQRLEVLDVHGNSLTELPLSLWNCASLTTVNATSNLLGVWHDPPTTMGSTSASVSIPDSSASSWTSHSVPERKGSATGSIGSTQSTRYLPPLVHSLEKLYLGENRLTDDVLHPLTMFKELRLLNLSFNDIQDLPASFFKNLTNLEELYLSGNKLSSIPTEDLHRLKQLAVLFLNGNRLQTLPQELKKIMSLSVLDVGSNVLKYNINNWKFDWNWNFNKNLRYLNLSGNKRLEITPETTSQKTQSESKEEVLADFSSLTHLRVLGLMDVTTTFAVNIPDENEDRRVRTSPSVVNNMAYGIADILGKNEHLNMLDLVQPEFRGRDNEAVFAMFGRAQIVSTPNKLSKILHDEFLKAFISQLSGLNAERNEGIPDALRRTFLRLNKILHDELYTISSKDRKNSQASASTAGVTFDVANAKSGASGVVLYFVDKTMYVANAGNALAVVSRQGSAEPVSTKHVPFDRSETARIRAAEGWISPKGFVNDEVDVSRSFGFYHLVPVVNARPTICVWELSELDEFVIIGNRGLWDYVSFQTAVDIARSERGDPMIAAQKLRDFAISYGAEGGTMIMVIAVADLFNVGPSRRPTMESFIDPDPYSSISKRRRRDDIIADRNISRLDGEVSPPTGHVALVFTDIRNSTHLWEANAGMPTAMRLHNNLLRRQLRFCGGYEVKTEGDAFMCSFPTALSALWWAMTVQVQLLNEHWPLEILECEDGREVLDNEGKTVARGLSVRMGIHCGMPACEPDPITHRMDYFGPMVNRSARICSSAAGGQIMCSADIIREINAKILGTAPDTELSDFQPPHAVDAIRRLGIVVVPVGEVKLKGLEMPEVLSVVYPSHLIGRQDFSICETDPKASSSRIQFSSDQIQELALLCLRLETLTSSRVFKPLAERKGSLQDGPLDQHSESVFLYADPNLLLPHVNEKATDAELMLLLDSLSNRIECALASLYQQRLDPKSLDILGELYRCKGDEKMLQKLMAVFQGS